MLPFHVVSRRSPHQKLFFDLKDQNYKKAKMKGGLGWMKKYRERPRSLFNGNHLPEIVEMGATSSGGDDSSDSL